jgi:hypothetical protein
MAERNNRSTAQKATKPEAAAKKGAAFNAIKLDAQNPLPIEFNSNIFVDLKGKRYVPFLNPSDNFAQLLTEAYLLSPTTLSCVSSKARYCVGNGLIQKDVKEGSEDPQFKSWSANVNRKQQSLNDILHGAFSNYFANGNPYIQVVRGMVAGKKFIRLYLRNTLDCRLSYPDDDDICNSVYISKYFRKLGIWNMNTIKTEEIPVYSSNMFDQPWARDEKGFEHTIFHLKNLVPGYDYYGMPSNVGSLPLQVLEYKSARYNLDNFENNMVIGGVVVFKGAMTEEEAKKAGRDIVYQHTGDGKRGRWCILSSEAGIGDGVEIKEFAKQEEGSFIESDKHNAEKIFMSNQWNKLLIGGSEQRGIGQGNSAYIRSVFDIANNTVIMPTQAMMKEKFLQPLLQICDEWMGTNWSTLNFDFNPIQPVSFLGDINVNAIITRNEGREIIGQPPMDGDKGEEIIAPGGKNTPPQNEGGDNVQDQ